MKALIFIIISVACAIWFLIRQNDNYKKSLKLIRLHEWDGDVTTIIIPSSLTSSSSDASSSSDSENGDENGEDTESKTTLSNNNNSEEDGDDTSSSSASDGSSDDESGNGDDKERAGDDDSNDNGSSQSQQQPQISKEDEEKERQIRKRMEEMEKQIMLGAIQGKKEEKHLKELLKSSATAAAVRAAMDDDETLIGEDLQDLEEFERQLVDSMSKWEQRYEEIMDAHKKLKPRIDPRTKSFARDKDTKLIIDDATGEPMSEDDSRAIELNAERVTWENQELEKLLAAAKLRLGQKTLTGRIHTKFVRTNPMIITSHHESAVVSSGSKPADASVSSDGNGDDGKQETNIPINTDDEGESQDSTGEENDAQGEDNGETGDANTSSDDGDSNPEGLDDEADMGSDDTGIDVATLESAHDIGEGGEADVRAAQAVLRSGKKALMSASKKQELKSQLQESENNIMKWTQAGKVVVVLGQKGYIGRDIVGYKWAFEKAGFKVKRPSSGRMSTTLLASDKWSVILCLSLNTEACFTSSSLSKTKRYQHINRLQGLRQVLWSKDSFCRTLSDGTGGDASFHNYTFDCWKLPTQYSQISLYAEKHPSSLFIVKPISMGGGMGISVVDGKGLAKVRSKTMIVQNYLMNPFLIKGRKWDLRTYVLVTSVYPLRVYLYSKGLVRFASRPYDPNAKSGGKRAQFLTNTSVGKFYVKGGVTELTWAFADLAKYLDTELHGVPVSYQELLSRIKAAISVVFLSAEKGWKKFFDVLDKKSTQGGSTEGEETRYCANCYQVMGVDLIVDDQGHTRVIEVNGQPSMKLTKTSTDHYTSTKKGMISDMLGLVYNEDKVADELINDLAEIDKSAIELLTKRDMEYLLDYKREGKKMGGFMRVYPNYQHRHLHTKFFQIQSVQNPHRIMMHNILTVLEGNAQGQHQSSSSSGSSSTATVSNDASSSSTTTGNSDNESNGEENMDNEQQQGEVDDIDAGDGEVVNID